MSYSIQSIDSINLQKMQSNGLNQSYPIKPSQETRLKKILTTDFEQLIQQIQFTTAFKDLFDQTSPEFHLSFSINQNTLEISNLDNGKKIVAFIEIDDTAAGSYKIISHVFQKATVSLRTSVETPRPLPSPPPFVAPSTLPSALSIEIEESSLPEQTSQTAQDTASSSHSSFSQSSISVPKRMDLPPSFVAMHPAPLSLRPETSQATSDTAARFRSAFSIPSQAPFSSPSIIPSASSKTASSTAPISISSHNTAVQHAQQHQPSSQSSTLKTENTSASRRPLPASPPARSSSPHSASRGIPKGHVRKSAEALRFTNLFQVKPQLTPKKAPHSSEDLEPLPRRASIHRSTHKKHFVPFRAKK